MKIVDKKMSSPAIPITAQSKAVRKRKISKSRLNLAMSLN
jgi:hypothetical protein